MSEAQLYRHYDADGVLLYVGISLNSIARLRTHKHSASWFSKIQRIEIEHFPDLRTAQQAEKTAISVECPKHNVMTYTGPQRQMTLTTMKSGQQSAKARGVKLGRKVEATPERIAKAKEAIRAGLSFREAAKSVGLAVSTLYRDIPGGAQSVLEDDVDLPPT
jgi:hypothetical protein